MKKTYIQPQLKVKCLDASDFICGSQDITSDQGINYGGVDEGGVKDPDAREYGLEYHSVWDED